MKLGLPTPDLRSFDERFENEGPVLFGITHWSDAAAELRSGSHRRERAYMKRAYAWGLSQAASTALDIERSRRRWKAAACVAFLCVAFLACLVVHAGSIIQSQNADIAASIRTMNTATAALGSCDAQLAQALAASREKRVGAAQ